MEKAVAGPSNIREAEDYKSKLDSLFDEFSIMIRNDDREALETTVRNVKRHMQGTWGNMAGAKVEVVLLTIKDPACTALRKPLEQDLVTTSDPDEDIPTGEDVFKTLPEGQKQKVKDDCISLFENMSAATHHISVAMANLASLAKNTDPETFRIILKSSVQPLVQLNLSDDILDITRDKPPNLQQKTHKETVKKDTLPDPNNSKLKKEPANSPTRLLTAAVYVKLNKHLFNEGTQTEAASRFNVKLKALGQILSGRCYLGGKDRSIAQKKQGMEEPAPQKKRKRPAISNDED